ncbi:peptidylprolyl isomerase [candidate division KSB1 bacterium]|nr:peptidylprolyl isomerase [candidate division KSB1 bacterium]
MFSQHLLFILLIISISPFSCSRNNDSTLAIIGHRKITIADFQSRFNATRQKIQIADNAQVRNEIFRSMIDEALLIHNARERGFLNCDAGKFEQERIKIQELLNCYLQQKVLKNIAISETELQNMFVRYNTKINARHLYALSRHQADSLYQLLLNGVSWEAIAHDIFQDPQLRDNGGSLGFFTVDEMDPTFEDSAFALPIGKISKPVRTATGYSIIQVQERQIRPLLTETEYTQRRDKLAIYVNYRKHKVLTRAFVDSMRLQLNIRFDESTLNKFWQVLKQQDENNNTIIDNEFKQQRLVRSKLGTWDVAAFQEQAAFSSDDQQRWIRNKENLQDFIAGIIVRSWIISQAKHFKLDQTDEYKAAVQTKLDDYLLTQMQQVIAEQTVIPEDTLRKYYQQNPEKFAIPPRIHLCELAVENENFAGAIISRLSQHESFEQLVRSFSVRRYSAENGGDIGEFSYNDLDAYADKIFPMKIGEWTGPILINNQYAFFKCVGKSAKQLRAYDEARPMLENGLRPMWEKKTRKALVDSIRGTVKVRTFPEKLLASTM